MTALVTALVTDALAAVDALPVAGLDDGQERAVALLALAAGQDVEPGETPGTWRTARAVAKDRIVSTVGSRVAARAQIDQRLPGRAQRSHRDRAGDRAGTANR